jgi:hypothetical protein
MQHTGKTFLGVKILQVLLSNTCNTQHLRPREANALSDIDAAVDLDDLVERHGEGDLDGLVQRRGARLES